MPFTSSSSWCRTPRVFFSYSSSSCRRASYTRSRVIYCLRSDTRCAPARAQVQVALSRAVAAMNQDREPGRKWDNFLPYNLSLELLSRQPAAADLESVLRCVCQGVAVQGVSVVLAFPQSREELLQVDLMASFLEIPFLIVVEHEEPLRTQVDLHLPTPEQGFLCQCLVVIWFDLDLGHVLSPD